MELPINIKDLLEANDDNVDVKPILPPSRLLAQIICGFANSSGGTIVLGASYKSKKGLEVIGLSSDFNANSITHKAIDLLSVKPAILSSYYTYSGKQLYVIQITSSQQIVTVEGNQFIRKGKETIDKNTPALIFNTKGYQKIKDLDKILISIRKDATDSKTSLLNHYHGLLKLLDNLASVLYPEQPSQPTTIPEGKILTRMLVSSMVDNFEIYLANLLYEIWLAKPETLKSPAQVSLEDVLKCADIEEFVRNYAKNRISKMQKGSVKTFIKENKQIRDLDIFTDAIQEAIESILQIRHLYAHRNGIIDEKFLPYYAGPLTIGNEHLLCTDEILEKMAYLIEVTNEVDKAAILKYSLSSL